MTISDKAFDSMSEDENVELLDFFIKNKGKAFALPFLESKFNERIIHDLLTLVIHDKIKSKTNEDVLYFRLNPKFPL